MKFTRMFVLKILSKNKYEIKNCNNINYNNYNNNDNIADNNSEDIFRDILLTNGNIDFFILLILNISIILSKFNLYYSNNKGLYIIIGLNLLFSMIYFLLFILNNNLYTPNLNIKKHISLPNNFNINNSNSKSGLNENLINEKNNNNNYYEMINNFLSNKLKINLPYFIINKYWHLFNCFFHLIQNLIFLSSFGLSFIFYIVYKAYESEFNKKFNFLHIILLQILEFYSIFRILFFMLKILLNLIMIPLYISSVFLGFVEDNFNLELNNIINTREYRGRDSKIIEDSCAICLGGFYIGDTISTLPCNKFHSFHTICLEEWFYTNVCCPLCRSDFNDKIRKLIPNNNNNNENQNNNNDLNNFNNNRFEMQEINPFNNNNN